MAVLTIRPEPLRSADPEQIRSWCCALEAGDVLYFPMTPVPVEAEDVTFLLGQQQSASNVHKNIAYKPGRDKLSGVDEKAMAPAAVARLHQVMRRYSKNVETFVSKFLATYQCRWRLDYASFRPFEEKGRELPLHRRNDLLHTDAFPTRPTQGWRILRFFHNIHPTRTRDWMVGEPFPKVVDRFAEKIGMPAPDGRSASAAKRVAQAIGLTALVPRWKRGPYDEFMIHLHNAMKEDSSFQASCARAEIHFAPGSSWMVYTDAVPHAVLAGQYALEQTFVVDPAAMVMRDFAPIAILEKMAGARLA